MSQGTPSSPPDTVFEYAAVLPDPGRRLLFLPEAGAWTLPRWEWAPSDGPPPFWQQVDGVNRALRGRFGLDATTLRCLRIDDGPDRRVGLTYEVEGHDPAWHPEGGRWVGPDDLAALPLAVAAHGEIARAWFDEASAPPAPNRPPWTFPGWFDGAVDWLRAELGRLGRRAAGPVEQLRAWERAALLRVPTDRGRVYFKAVPPVFAHEAPLAAEIGRLRPGGAPEILALDPARHWALTADFGGPTLDEVPDLPRWEAALGAFAAIQVATVAHPTRLAALGCPRRRIADLPDDASALLNDPDALLVGREGGLQPGQVDRLRDLLPAWREQIAALDRIAVPAALEHGDFWAANVAAAPGGYVFFDWSDSSLAHPFFSPLLFLDDAARTFPAAPGLRARLRDAYLAPWAAFAPRADLIEAFDLAQGLAPLHLAVAYHHRILPALHARWEMERMVPYYLGLLLADDAGRDP